MFLGFSLHAWITIATVLTMNFIILAANIFIVNVLYPLTPLQ